MEYGYICNRSIDNSTSVSQPQKQKPKNIIKRQYHENDLKMGISGSSEMNDPRLWCLVRSEKL